MQIVRANKFRLYPSAKQKQILHEIFGSSRFVFNQVLGMIQNKEFGQVKTKQNKVVSRIPAQTELINSLTQIKENHQFLYSRPNDLLQSSLSDLHAACQKFYKGAGFPKFKSRKSKHQSIEMKAGSRIKLNGNSVILPIPRNGIWTKDDLMIPFKSHKTKRILPNKLVKYTISKDNLNKYWISFSYKIDVVENPKSTKKSVGIDLGIQDLVICSDGSVFGNQKLTKKSSKKLRFHQKSMSRKKKFGHNWNKSKIKVAKIHKKIANQRNFRNHDISSKLVKKYDFIILESLKIKNMMQNRKLSKSIADASWFDLISKIRYKMTEKQGHFHQIDTWFPSSQTCSNCGSITKMPLKIREYRCLDCGMTKERDLNAAINIHHQGCIELGMNPPELIKIKPFA